MLADKEREAALEAILNDDNDAITDDEESVMMMMMMMTVLQIPMKRMGMRMMGMVT